jgi:hypothetical protein
MFEAQRFALVSMALIGKEQRIVAPSLELGACGEDVCG